MKKVLTIVLASVLSIQNTRGIMASDAPGIGGDDNTALAKTLQNRDQTDAIVSYLPLKEIGRNRLVSKSWNEWIQRNIQHLSPHATWADIQGFLNFPDLKIPFYYSPKNARRNMNDFFLKPDSWEMMLSVLKNKKHALQDQQLFLEEGLGSTKQRVTPILDMLFNAERTREEKQEFIQNSLLNPEVITFLGKTPALMDEIKIEAGTRNMIIERFHFLETLLRAIAPRDTYEHLMPYEYLMYVEYVMNQSNISFKALGLLGIAVNTNVYYDRRIDATKTLASLGEEYKPQAIEICGSIATDTNVTYWSRINAARILARLGEEYKYQAAQAYFSIATDTNVDPGHRIEAAKILAGWGEKYKLQAIQICRSIAQATQDSCIKACAEQALRSLRGF